MRSKDVQRTAMWTTVSTEDMVPLDHPLRAIRVMVNAALTDLSPAFAKLYSPIGRPSIPPEKQLRAILLQMLYTVRSERMLMEQLRYNMLFRWFVGLSIEEPVWDVTVFTKNRERFLQGEIADRVFEAVLAQARAEGLLSDEHFTVDGALIEAWASHKSFKPKGDQEPPSGGTVSNPTIDFNGTKRSNETHRSTTDSDARLYRKSANTGAQLGYLGHALMENRNGLVVDGRLTLATGKAEREAALGMIDGIAAGSLHITLGADKGYDTAEFVAELRARGVKPHVAQNNTNRRSAIDARTTRHEGYEQSQRKRVEEIFGWEKVVAGIRKVKVRGLDRVGAVFTFGLAAFNLVRMRKLIAVGA